LIPFLHEGQRAPLHISNVRPFAAKPNFGLINKPLSSLHQKMRTNSFLPFLNGFAVYSVAILPQVTKILKGIYSAPRKMMTQKYAQNRK
jgi:hypothetical protein